MAEASPEKEQYETSSVEKSSPDEESAAKVNSMEDINESDESEVQVDDFYKGKNQLSHNLKNPDSIVTPTINLAGLKNERLKLL